MARCLIMFLFSGILGRAVCQSPQINYEPVKLEIIYLPAVDLPIHGPLVITMRVCPANINNPDCDIRREEWQRVTDEVNLYNMIYKDLHNVKTGSVDFGLRKSISKLEKRLAESK